MTTWNIRVFNLNSLVFHRRRTSPIPRTSGKGARATSSRSLDPYTYVRTLPTVFQKKHSAHPGHRETAGCFTTNTTTKHIVFGTICFNFKFVDVSVPTARHVVVHRIRSTSHDLSSFRDDGMCMRFLPNRRVLNDDDSLLCTRDEIRVCRRRSPPKRLRFRRRNRRDVGIDFVARVWVTCYTTFLLLG